MTLRNFPIVFVGEIVGYWCPLSLLPVYAFAIYFKCTLIDIIFEKTIGKIIDTAIARLDAWIVAVRT